MESIAREVKRRNYKPTDSCIVCAERQGRRKEGMPHGMFKKMKEFYPDINVINKAVSNKNGGVSLHIVDDDDENSGLSTVLDYEYTKNWRTIYVDCITMESFLDDHHEISSIDILKIDVEGLNYEVLEGFGKKLGIVKSIQIESEFINYHEQHSFKDIAIFLYAMGFEMVDFNALYRQNDSLWIRKDFLNTIPIY